MSYATNDTIRAVSSLRTVKDAGDGLLDFWGRVAKQEIDQFCNRDFLYEEDVEKSFLVTSPLIVLDKEVSAITAAEWFTEDNTSMGDIDYENDFLVVPPNNRQIRYQNMTGIERPYPITPRLVKITANWGTATVPTDVELVYMRLVERIAARIHEDDVLQQHSPYQSQDDGDQYNYSLDNGTLRNLLRPEDRAQLWKWVSHGRVTA